MAPQQRIEVVVVLHQVVPNDQIRPGDKGMGHCVPGMKKESPTNCLTKDGITLGMPNDDIDAIQLSFDFLLRFTLP